MNKKIIIGIILIILILSGAYFGIYKFKKNRINLSSQDFQNILRFHNGGDFNPSKAILEIENFISKKNNPKEESYAKVLLGYDYLFFIEPIKGIEILKEIISKSDCDYCRAFAIGIIGDRYESYPDKDFSKEYVFTGDFFEQFIKENPKDVDLAYEKLYEFSNGLFPHTITNYRIGLWHSNELLRNKNLSFEQKEDYVLRIKEKIAEGDKLYNSLKQPSLMGLALQIKASILTNLYFYDNKNITKFQIKDYFRKSLLILTTGDIDGQMKFFSLYARFHYATFLAKVENPAPADEIKRLLEPLYDVSIRNYLIFDFLRLVRDTADSPHKNDIENLSKIDSRFKFLIEQL
ncbi:MAG: hypothetical protein AAB504_01775 [Patescibacteria group bacterium]